jgi:DNA gyrase subunit A
MYFLQFRLQVGHQSLEHELEALRKRIHILEGFEKVFDALDEIIKIIRKSEGKADSAEKIIKRFGSTPSRRMPSRAEAVSARTARDPRHSERAADKRKRARQISSLLKDEKGRWKVVRDEIERFTRSTAAGTTSAGR